MLILDAIFLVLSQWSLVSLTIPLSLNQTINSSQFTHYIGSCTLPYFGIDFAILDQNTGKEITTQEAEGVLCIKRPWPSIARTVHGDHDRYLTVYLRPYANYYFTGDGARRDKDGYYWITGRVDDVINPSGHRLGTAEFESALVACRQVAEAAVVGFPHEIKGEGIGCFVILRENVEVNGDLTKHLKEAVREAIGPIATPDFIVFCDLPKVRLWFHCFWKVFMSYFFSLFFY